MNQQQQQVQVQHQKQDAQKVRMELLPQRAMYEVATVLTHGAAKYAPDAWRQEYNYQQ